MRYALCWSLLVIFAACSSSSSTRSGRKDGTTPQAEEVVDTDGDGLPDDEDPCPNDAANLDSDSDGVCDDDDGCPNDPTQSIDSDGDGNCDETDECPDDDGGWVDSNGDGLCNGDDDTDGDGLSDNEEGIYGDDCGVSDPTLVDTDGDGIADNEDPYPRDPWAEFILYRNDVGTIDFMLSNRDGTFEPPLEVGDVYGGFENPAYRYIQFLISDFDDNGQMDFLALGDPDPTDDDYTYDVWWFWRTKFDELHQRLVGQTVRSPFGTAADLNNDDIVDLVGVESERPNTIASILLRYYGNQEKIDTATCFATDDPANPNECAFVSKLGVDITSWVVGQWSYRQSRDAVDVDGDGHRDIAIMKISSGSNSSNVPITVLYGRGDGTFDDPGTPLFTHNNSSCGGSPANSLLFGDFDNNDVGDVIAGLDDDGDAGSAWFYPGTIEGGAYGVDSSSCVEAFDLNPAHESGSEHPGVSGSAHNFDFDFDGVQDVIVGYRYQDPWTGPSKTVVLFGVGDGTFGAPVLVRDFPTSNYGNEFAVPKRVCARFPMELSD